MSNPLNHPLKRLAFVLFVITTIALGAMLVGPAVPLTIERYSDWKDVTEGHSADRTITRLDTGCAGKLFGTVEDFAKDFFILEAATNLYSEVLLQDSAARGKVTIAETVDVTEEDEHSYRSQLSNNAKPCVGDGRLRTKLCVETLTASSLDSTLASCGSSVAQYRVDQTEFRWRVVENFEHHAPWSMVALVLAVAFLLMSVLYAKTLGPIVRWILKG